MDGIFNIYKEKGFTSHDVVAIVRRTIGQKKVGHTGTLDPDAEGVLPICVGKGTKLADYIMADVKGYRAEVTFGITTTTQDSSGEIIEKKDVIYDEDEIRHAVMSFVGDIEQIPPMYSTIKINGKKLYELARKGQEVERKARKIKIHDIKILEFLPPDKIVIDVLCSKGTYIRTLCVDIGEKLGYGAHMSKLLRTMSGSFKLENAIKLDDLKKLAEENRLEEALLNIDYVLRDYKKLYVSKKARKFLHNGCKVYDNFFEKTDSDLNIGDEVLVYDDEKMFVGIFTVIRDDDKICVKPLKMLL